MTGPASRTIALTLFSETWPVLVRRQFMRPVDRLAQYLMQDPEVGQLYLCEPWRSAPVRWVRRALERSPEPAPQPRPGGPTVRLVSPTRLRRRDPRGPAALGRSYRAYGRAVRRAAGGSPLDAVITCNPLVAAFSGLHEVAPLTYYARDDFAEHPRYQASWPAFRQAYRQLRDNGTRVVAVSAPLLEAIAPTGPGLVLPNGIEPGEWTGPAPDPPGWLAALPRPWLLYTGSLDERLSAPLVRRAAEAAEGGTVVLLGPTILPAHVAELTRAPNVVSHPSVGRQELVRCVRSADVCLLPHTDNGLTRAMSPLKLYEYLAAGAPVASVDLPPVHGLHPRVRICAPGQDYAQVVRAALEDGALPEPERLAFVAENSWPHRFRSLLSFALS